MREISAPLTEQVARAMKKRRVALDYKQSEAAARAGVTLSTLQKFEQTGRISLERFLKLCFAYRMDNQILNAVESRDFWTFEQIKRADAKKAVR
jgi:transcriptional regulator with XRE-family HTH domain